MYEFPSLLAIGLPLIGLPVLIHLINMMRHRRVKWAAMDFLLQSQKRLKKWIILKQLFLLLARMAAVAIIAFMVAQPILRSEWGELFGGASTHHIVLLDDSYSMSERLGDGAAFSRGKQVVERLARQAAAQGGAQSFTLLRFSNCADLALGSQPDIQQQEVGAEFGMTLERLLAPLEPSQTAVGPAAAFEAVRRLPTRGEEEDRVVYIVSDFRTREWNEPTAVRKAIDELNQDKTQVHLVHCSDTTQPNLTITELKPLVGTRAAGVELFMELAVKNFGDDTVKNVSIRLAEDDKPRPGLDIDVIGPGETVIRRFRVNFAAAGQHKISAALGDNDPVTTDNRRFTVIDMPSAVEVLVIDGAPQGRDGYFMSAALAPGGKVVTGVSPRVEAPRFLRKHDELAKFACIFLLNVERLDPPEIDALENFAKAGGGVGIFLGEQATARFYNEQLYRDGQGIFPLPLTISTDLLADRVDKAPDLKVEDHPIFKTFLSMRNNPLDDVLVERYFAVPSDWQPATDSTVKVLARLRNGAPLVVEQQFGQGRVVALLTKVSPETTQLGSWNNWARNHSFLPTMLNLQGYLGSGKQLDIDRSVGGPLQVEFDPQQYQSQVRFVTPTGEGEQEVVIDAQPTKQGLAAAMPNTGVSGIYTARLTTTDNKPEPRYFAFNVSAEEGDLHNLDGEQLAVRLEGLLYKFHRAADLEYDADERAGFHLRDSLLYLLLILLIGEQALAYAASYHPPRTGVAR